MYTRSYTTERDGRTFVVHVLPDQEIPVKPAPYPRARNKGGQKVRSKRSRNKRK